MNELKQRSRRVIYQGKIFDLIVDDVEYPDGVSGIREVVHHPGGAAVVPLLDDGRVIMVRQLRYPFGRHILELPAGKLAPGEDPAVCAARELTEETGWVAGRLERLTSILTTPGFCDEVLHLYLGTGLRQSPQGHRRERGEFTMAVEIVPFADAMSMVRRGDIEDAKTIVGLMMADEKNRRTTK